MSSFLELKSDPFAPANVSDLTDVQPKDHKMDCYYATLAGILQKTIPDLEKQTKIFAVDGMSLRDIDLLYQKAGYTGKFVYTTRRDDFKARLKFLFQEQQKKLHEPEKSALKMKLAAGFLLEGQDVGHFVAVKYWSKNQEYYYRVVDFQVEKDNRFTQNFSTLPEDSKVIYYIMRDAIFYYSNLHL